MLEILTIAIYFKQELFDDVGPFIRSMLPAPILEMTRVDSKKTRLKGFFTSKNPSKYSLVFISPFHTLYFITFKKGVLFVAFP